MNIAPDPTGRGCEVYQPVDEVGAGLIRWLSDEDGW